MKDWRPLTWIIVVVNILFAAWIIGGIGAAADTCAGKTGDELEWCQAGAAIGGTAAVGIIVFFWVAVDMVLGIVWLVTGKSGRECPACGRKVKRGLTSCGKCGHSFAAVVRSDNAPSLPPAVP